MRTRGIHLPYTHQAQATEAALGHDNAVVVTPTASGKTLCYNLPVLHPCSTILMPGRCTCSRPRRWPRPIDRVENAGRDTAGGRDRATYDGDTPKGHRKRIRERGQIVLSNPDMLHTGILPHHTGWAEFSRGLRQL